MNMIIDIKVFPTMLIPNNHESLQTYE